jgi:hypothetical protein
VPTNGQSDAAEKEAAAVKGGIIARFTSWLGSVFVGLVVVGGILIAVVGAPSTAVLYSVGAGYGGTSTGITLAAIPQFFASVKTGQALGQKGPSVKAPTPAPSPSAGAKPCTKKQKAAGVCV